MVESVRACGTVETGGGFSQLQICTSMLNVLARHRGQKSLGLEPSVLDHVDIESMSIFAELCANTTT